MTVATTATVDPPTVERFDRTERVLHWVTAVAVLVAVVTGLILYVRPLSVAVSRRTLVREIHVVAGFVSVLPVFVALAGPWGRALRADVSRFANWHDDDVRWFRRRHRAASQTGKFTGGQKVGAVLFGAGLVVLLGTGSIMRWFGPFPLEWRTGATFVHDWVSFGLWILVPFHIVKALVTPGAMRAMWSGRYPRAEAERRPRWWAELDSSR